MFKIVSLISSTMC